MYIYLCIYSCGRIKALDPTFSLASCYTESKTHS